MRRSLRRLRIIPEHFSPIVPKATDYQPKMCEGGTKALYFPKVGKGSSDHFGPLVKCRDSFLIKTIPSALTLLRPAETQEIFYQRKKIQKRSVFRLLFLIQVFASGKLNKESTFSFYFIILNSK